MSHPQSRTGALAQLSSNPGSPASNQLLRVGESMKASSPLRKEYEMGDDHGCQPKKSLLAKVKDKAKKWKHNLSKKKFNEDNIPSGVVSMDDEEDEDPEFLRAPVYESEMTPDKYKETARQHPRANPVITENHDLPRCSNCGAEQKSSCNDKAINESLTTKEEEKSATTHTETANRNMEEEVSPNMQSETVTGNQEEENSAKSRAETLTQNLSVSIPGLENAAEKETAAAFDGPGSVPEVLDQNAAESQGSGRIASQMWDKGLSMKNFIMQKLEPGEDEKALSKVISDAMSPRRSPKEAGVVGKMKEAVSSMLWNEDSSQAADSSQTAASSQPASCHSYNNSASSIPVSTNAHDATKKESQESNVRTLQAN